LRFAESLLTGRVLAPDELHPVLTLTANAAAFSADPSAVEILRRFLNHEVQRIRIAALVGLAIVPGEEAERLMLETARNSRDNYTDEFIVDLIRARKSASEAGRPSAPGWRIDKRR
jgi:hypothetical protein